MSSKVKVIDKNEGRKIDWKQTGTKLTFGDDELTINVAKYQKDWPTHVDICGDKDGNLVIGVGEGRFYAAQVDIPEQKYTDPEPIEPTDEDEGGMQQFTQPEPIPLDMADVTLTLWALDGLRD